MMLLHSQANDFYEFKQSLFFSILVVGFDIPDEFVVGYALVRFILKDQISLFHDLFLLLATFHTFF